MLVPTVYATGNTLIRWKLSHLPAEPLTTMFLGIGSLFLLPLSLMPPVLARLDVARPAEPHDWPLALGSVALLGIVGTGVCVLLFIRLIQSQGPLFAGMITYIVPVVALLWSYVDNEHITRQQTVAIVGVLMMVTLVQWGAAVKGGKGKAEGGGKEAEP